MNEKQQRNDDLQERLIESAVRVLDGVESLPNSIPSLPSSLLARNSIFHPHGESIAQQYNHGPIGRTRGKYPTTDP